MTRPHRDAIGIHKGAYAQDSDPGAVGVHKLWVDTTGGVPPYPLYLRNASNTDWEAVAGGGGGGGGGGSLPLTTAGDMLYEDSGPAPARLPYVADGQMMVGASGLPAWSDPATFLAGLLVSLLYVAKDGGSGHVGVIRDIDPNIILVVEGGMDGTVDQYALQSLLHAASASTTNNIGISGQVTLENIIGDTIVKAAGLSGFIDKVNAGTVDGANAVEGEVEVEDGVVTNLRNFYAKVPHVWAGSAGTVYGLQVENQGGSGIGAHWGVHADDKINANDGYYIGEVPVLSAQGAAVADATGSGDIVAQFNALLASIRAIGVIAT